MRLRPLLWEAAQRVMRLDRRLLCSVPGSGAMHLTFDDGPDPAMTPWVLDALADHGAKATFFLIGRNAQAHTRLVERIRTEGHTIGSHTWDHEDAWRTPRTRFLDSVQRAADLLGSRLFRPPYGHITPALISSLHGHQHIVQWSLLAGDFLPHADPVAMSTRILQRAHGSIVVLHDTARCAKVLGPALPLVLRGLADRGVPMHALRTTGYGAPSADI